MSRKLKFRVWSSSGKYMIVNDDHYVYLSLGGEPVEFGREDVYAKEDCIIMQWTGLTDKYDGPIYEDDLVENESGRIFKVVWFPSLEMACWDLVVVNVNKGGPQHTLWAGLKVIGNIHQNPELLSQ